jgi:hypothetical protein
VRLPMWATAQDGRCGHLRNVGRSAPTISARRPGLQLTECNVLIGWLLGAEMTAADWGRRCGRRGRRPPPSIATCGRRRACGTSGSRCVGRRGRRSGRLGLSVLAIPSDYNARVTTSVVIRGGRCGWHGGGVVARRSGGLS